MLNLVNKFFRKPKQKLKEGSKLSVYIHSLEFLRRAKEGEPYVDITPEKNSFIYLDGIKGTFKVENLKEMGHSVQYLFDLIRENPPKKYGKKIEKINGYSTKEFNMF